jgi:hypothetical protein
MGQVGDGIEKNPRWQVAAKANHYNGRKIPNAIQLPAVVKSKNYLGEKASMHQLQEELRGAAGVCTYP